MSTDRNAIKSDADHLVESIITRDFRAVLISGLPTYISGPGSVRQQIDNLIHKVPDVTRGQYDVVQTTGKPFAIVKLENQCCVDALVDHFRYGDHGQPITFGGRVLDITTMPWGKEPRLFSNVRALRTTYAFAIGEAQSTYDSYCKTWTNRSRGTQTSSVTRVRSTSPTSPHEPLTSLAPSPESSAANAEPSAAKAEPSTGIRPLPKPSAKETEPPAATVHKTEPVSQVSDLPEGLGDMSLKTPAPGISDTSVPRVLKMPRSASASAYYTTSAFDEAALVESNEDRSKIRRVGLTHATETPIIVLD